MYSVYMYLQHSLWAVSWVFRILVDVKRVHVLTTNCVSGCMGIPDTCRCTACTCTYNILCERLHGYSGYLLMYSVYNFVWAAAWVFRILADVQCVHVLTTFCMSGCMCIPDTCRCKACTCTYNKLCERLHGYSGYLSMYSVYMYLQHIVWAAAWVSGYLSMYSVYMYLQHIVWAAAWVSGYLSM